MASLFQQGRIVDLILLFLALEIMGISLIRVSGRAFRGPAFRPVAIVVNAGAGAALLMALRAGLRSLEWPHVACWLLAALVFHVWDLTLRGSMPRTR